jgi:hypothetical protein
MNYTSGAHRRSSSTPGPLAAPRLRRTQGARRVGMYIYGEKMDAALPARTRFNGSQLPQDPQATSPQRDRRRGRDAPIAETITARHGGDQLGCSTTSRNHKAVATSARPARRHRVHTLTPSSSPRHQARRRIRGLETGERMIADRAPCQRVQRSDGHVQRGLPQGLFRDEVDYRLGRPTNP